MSFILDALKKSEAERQRNHGPALAEVPFGRRRGTQPWWLIGLGTALLLSIVVLIAVLLRMQTSIHAASVERPTAAAQTAQAQPIEAATTRLPGSEAAAPAADHPMAATPATPSPARNSTVGPAPSLPPSNQSLAEEAAPESADTESGPPGADLSAAAAVPEREPIVKSIAQGRVTQPEGPYAGENLPTINELSGKLAEGLPVMHLDIHVYASKPADRFVFINMHKYVEGDSTTDGLLVERIAPDGVVLNQRGLRFLLPRQ